MTPFEYIIAGAIVVGFVAKLVSPLWDSNRHKVKNDATRDFVDSIIRAAEELDVSGQLGGLSKKEWVKRRIVGKYPQYANDLEGMDILVNAAVQAAGLGMTGKRRERKPSRKK